ncbi:hypothetical protein J3E74DRAFT_358720 [Bipolaris maydis]|nr:hypothetical protein J3E74DRAFT_358720 [Bipolaris maydis]
MAPQDTTFITIVLASIFSCPSQVIVHPACLPGFWRCKCLYTYYRGPAFFGDCQYEHIGLLGYLCLILSRGRRMECVDFFFSCYSFFFPTFPRFFLLSRHLWWGRSLCAWLY